MDIGRMFGRIEDAMTQKSAFNARSRDEELVELLAREIEARPEEWAPVREHVERWRWEATALRAKAEALDLPSGVDHTEVSQHTIGAYRVLTRVGCSGSSSGGTWMRVYHPCLGAGNYIGAECSPSYETEARLDASATRRTVERATVRGWRAHG